MLRVRLWSETPTLTNLEQYLRVNTLVVIQNAEEGSVATSTLTFDDQAGTLSIPAHQRMDVYEDAAAPGEQLIHVGATTIREYDRGQGRVLAERGITVSLDDTGTLFHRRLMTESSANRPAETDVARTAWALAHDDMRGVYDQQYVSTANPVDMDAVDYRGQFLAAVWDDCAQQSGKNWYVFWNDTLSTAIASSSVANPTVITTSVPHKLGTGFSVNFVTISGHTGSTPDINGFWLATPTSTTTFTIPLSVSVGGTGGTVRYASLSMWYDFSSSSAYPSTVKVSNVAADSSATVFHSAAPTMRSDPTRIYSGILVPYNGGSVYRTDATIASTIIDRDTVAPAVNVTTAAKANARGDRYLTANTTDEQVVTLAVPVSGANVNRILPGHLLPVKATHLPGMSDYVNTRVLNRTVRQIGIDTYQVDLETVVVGPAPGEACAPIQNAHNGASLNADYDVVLPAAPTEDNTLVAIFWQGNSETWTPTTIGSGGWTLRADGFGYDATQYGGPGGKSRLVVYTRIVGAGESATTTIVPGIGFSACTIVEIPGTYVSATTSGNVTKTAGQELSVSRTSTGAAIVLAAWSMQRTTYAPQDSVATSDTEIRDRWALEDAGFRAPHTWVAWTNTATAATMTVTGAPNANPNLNKWGIFAAGLLFDCN